MGGRRRAHPGELGAFSRVGGGCSAGLGSRCSVVRLSARAAPRRWRARDARSLPAHALSHWAGQPGRCAGRGPRRPRRRRCSRAAGHPRWSPGNTGPPSRRAGRSGGRTRTARPTGRPARPVSSVRRPLLAGPAPRGRKMHLEGHRNSPPLIRTHGSGADARGPDRASPLGNRSESQCRTDRRPAVVPVGWVPRPGSAIRRCPPRRVGWRYREHFACWQSSQRRPRHISTVVNRPERKAST